MLENLGVQHKKKQVDYFAIKEIYSTGLKVAQRVGSDTKIWNKRIGDSIVRMAEHRMNDETRMIPLSFYKEAILFYKAAGLSKKVKETEHQYFDLKKELKLSKFEIPLDEDSSQMLFDYIEKKTKKLLELNSEQIWGYLLSGNEIFPDKKWLVEMAKKQGNSFLDFVTTIKFDINNNISKGKDNNEKEKIYETYRLYMKLFKLLDGIG